MIDECKCSITHVVFVTIRECTHDIRLSLGSGQSEKTMVYISQSQTDSFLYSAPRPLQIQETSVKCVLGDVMSRDYPTHFPLQLVRVWAADGPLV